MFLYTRLFIYIGQKEKKNILKNIDWISIVTIYCVVCTEICPDYATININERTHKNGTIVHVWMHACLHVCINIIIYTAQHSTATQYFQFSLNRAMDI